MSPLPFDIARCIGTTASLCCLCRRREPGDQLQVYIATAWSLVHGTCPNFIGTPTIYTNSTKPNATLTAPTEAPRG